MTGQLKGLGQITSDGSVASLHAAALAGDTELLTLLLAPERKADKLGRVSASNMLHLQKHRLPQLREDARVFQDVEGQGLP
eukprot:SAG31_NODE_31073_length_372_cov_1.293040_2_plen_80_part_01